MSLRATLWALDEAPVDDAVAALILIGLADEANDDGTDSCPYKDKLIKRARKSERTVQTHLRNLYQARLIEFGDQQVAMRRYGKAAGHAPRAWNLNMQYTWNSRPEPRGEEEMVLYARFMATGRVNDEASEGAEPGGVQKLHPTADQGKRGYPQEGGVQPTAPFPIGSKTNRKTSRSSREDVDVAPGSSTVRPEEDREKISSLTKDQEEAFDLADDVEFFPDLTDLERILFDECRLAAGDRWSVRVLRKVIGTPLIRRLADEDPDLVRKAFVIGAHDEGTTSPRRLLWLEKCPHWRRARTELAAAARNRENDGAPAPSPRSQHDADCRCGGTGWVDVPARQGAAETIARCSGTADMAQAS